MASSPVMLMLHWSLHLTQLHTVMVPDIWRQTCVKVKQDIHNIVWCQTHISNIY